MPPKGASVARGRSSWCRQSWPRLPRSDRHPQSARPAPVQQSGGVRPGRHRLQRRSLAWHGLRPSRWPSRPPAIAPRACPPRSAASGFPDRARTARHAARRCRASVHL